MNVPEQTPQPEREPEPERADPARMRASDADRDRVADQLREALAEGRLTPDEHAERIDAVYTARTYAELEPVLRDLPSAVVPGVPFDRPRVELRKESPLPAPNQQSPQIMAIFGGADRKGRWLVGPQTNVVAVFGGIDLDFREAVLSQREVAVNIVCVFSGVELKVPPGVRVINDGVGIFGGYTLPDDEPLEPDAPVIRVTGFALFGGVDIKRREPKEDRRARRRAIREERRDRIREIHEERHRHLRELRESRRPHRDWH